MAGPPAKTLMTESHDLTRRHPHIMPHGPVWTCVDVYKVLKARARPAGTMKARLWTVVEQGRQARCFATFTFLSARTNGSTCTLPQPRTPLMVHHVQPYEYQYRDRNTATWHLPEACIILCMWLIYHSY